MYNKPGFFLDLLDDPLIGEPSCADFDQAFPAVSQKCGQAKLPHKNDPRAAWIIEQNRGTIAGIINLAVEALEAPIETLACDAEFFQQSIAARNKPPAENTNVAVIASISKLFAQDPFV